MRTSSWRSLGSQEPVTRFWGWGDARNAYPSRDVVASRSRSRSPAPSSGSWSTWVCTASNVPNPHLADELGPQGTSALPTCETDSPRRNALRGAAGGGHCLCAHLLRVGERCPFARRRLRSPQWVPRGPPFGFAPAERAQAPLHKVVRGQGPSCGPDPGREYRRRPWSPPLSGSPLGGDCPTPLRHSYRPEQVSAPPRLHPGLPGLDGAGPAVSTSAAKRVSPQSQDRGMALAANVDIPTNLGIRAAPSEQRAELSHTRTPTSIRCPGAI